jgi:hypothetical protein
MPGKWLQFTARIRARLHGSPASGQPLGGAPAVRRQKTYSAESGYVYLYYFDGFRDTPEAWEYVFTVSGDRKVWFPLTVIADRATLAAWSREHGRELTASERFAVAKIALRRAFDARIDPAAMREPVAIDAAEMRAIAEALDLV